MSIYDIKINIGDLTFLNHIETCRLFSHKIRYIEKHINFIKLWLLRKKEKI